jgi:hypothetical protein
MTRGIKEQSMVKYTSGDFKIRVERTIDSDEWVWSVLDSEGGVRCDGYSGTEAEAYKNADRARRDEIEFLNPIARDPRY